MPFIIDAFLFHCKSDHKQGKPNKVTGIYVNQTVFFLINRAVHDLNNFWNLFLDKLYLKNEW